MANNDNSDPDEDGLLAAFGPRLLMAVRFFSRLPTGPSDHEQPSLRRMSPLLPVAGLIIGVGPAFVMAGTYMLGGHLLFAATIGVLASVLVTGAMAEDALADSADGLFGGSSPARRLEIMHDSRQGTYGVAAIVFFVLIRVTVLAALMALSPFFAALAWVGISVASRSFALWLPTTLGPARSDGAGAAAGAPDLSGFTFGAALAALLALVLCLPLGGLFAGPATVAAMALTILLWRAYCERKVGGSTGDLTGGGQALLEIVGLSFFMLWVV